MSSSDRRSLLRRLLAIALAPLLGVAGFGFHLRGNVSHPFDTLYMNAPTAPAFAAELRRGIEGSKGTKMVENPTAAQAILEIASVVDDKQVLSLSGGGRVREYSLTKRVQFSVRDAQGRE